jgi:hypothetical protein
LLIAALQGAKTRRESGIHSEPAQKVVRDIRRATRKHYSAEEKIRIVLEGLRGEEPIAALSRLRRNQKALRDLFDLSWRRQVETETAVMATGFSCRCQSQRFAGRELRHPLGVIADLLSRCS